MRVNIDLQLILDLMGLETSAVYILWDCILCGKSEEERTELMEALIRHELSEYYEPRD